MRVMQEIFKLKIYIKTIGLEATESLLSVNKCETELQHDFILSAY